MKALADGREDVVLEGASPPSFAPGRVISAERSLDGARIEAESSGPGLLVVNDAWDAGWHATLDGQPAQLLPADGVVRAVRWPGGRHVLAMAYDPYEVRVGSWLSLLGLGVLVAVVIGSRRQENRHGG